MSVQKILEAYKEFQVILSVVEEKWDINEKLNLVEVITEKNFDLQIIKELNQKVINFEVLCNPFSYDCEDIIYNLENGRIEISEIESVSIQLEKDIFAEDTGCIDYYFFNQNCVLEAIQSIATKNNKLKLNIGLPSGEYIETETIVFVPLKQDTDINSIKKINTDTVVQENIKFYLSNNKRGNQNYYFNPYAFMLIDSSYSDTNFVNLLKQYFYLTVLECLSDKKKEAEFVIRGEKSIKVIVDGNFETSNYESFKELFEFLISAKKYTEKYLIIKKVFSLYIIDQESLTSMDKKLFNIWKTVNHYYDHYIEDNLKDFFKTKDQLLKEAMNVSKVIYEQTDRINTSIVASLLSIIIVFVTTLYRSMDNLTATYFACIVLIFIAFSSVYYYLMHNSANKRFELTEKQFSYFLDEISVMQPDEVKKLKETYLDIPNQELQKTLTRLLVILIVINSLLLLALFTFLCIKYNVCLC